MRASSKLFLFYLVSVFAAGVVLYPVAALVLGSWTVFGGLPRMFSYHDEHPIQYVFVVALSFAVIATAYARTWPTASGWRRLAGIIAVLVGSVFLASIPGGVLWKIHDMQAGYFPQGTKFWSDIAGGAVMGLELGWLIVLLSFPYNLCCACAAYWLVVWGIRLATPTLRADQQQTT